MANLVEHAQRELELAKAGESMYGDMLPQAVIELIKVFSNQGHSGMSAGITLDLFNKLARFEPWMPLTGADDEWNEVGGMFQNARCSHVFKDSKTGRAYDSQGIIFQDANGATYTKKESHVFIEFPYIPKSEIRLDYTPPAGQG